MKAVECRKHEHRLNAGYHHNAFDLVECRDNATQTKPLGVAEADVAFMDGEQEQTAHLLAVRRCQRKEDMLR